MTYTCHNTRCKHFGIFGCKLDDITIGGAGTCQECDYKDAEGETGGA